MTLAHMTLDDLGGALSWRALLHFVGGLGATSALVRELRPELDEMAPWLDGSMVAPLLADLIDCLNMQRWERVVAASGKRPRRPKRVTRPWEGDSKGVRVIGRDPIPVSEFESWWESAGRRGDQRG